jgi:iron complex outermembrane recepter protein
MSVQRMMTAFQLCALSIVALPCGAEEVLVTAQRREQPMQTVPMSLSVLDSQQLESRQIDALESLQFAVPNLVITQNQTSRTAAGIAMRGHFERDTAPTVDPAVGLYVDGVYVARSTGANLRLHDVERVEVMRGPQGTLFGRNTIGGAINVVPKRPNREQEAAVSGTVGNYDRREAAGVLNLPHARSGLALRLAATHSEHSGFARGTRLDRDIAGEESDFVRGQLRFTHGKRWDMNLSLDYTKSDAQAQWLTLVAALPLSAGVPPSQGNPTDSISNYVDPYGTRMPVNRAGRATSTVVGSSATIGADFGGATFKATSAFRTLEIHARDADQDGTPYDISAVVERIDRQDQFSQELQLFGRGFGDRLDWIGGLYYFEESGTFTQRFPMMVAPAFDPVEMVPWGKVSNDSMAAYAQATYSLTPRVRATAGIRYNEDRRQLTSRNTLRRRGTQFCRLDARLLDDPASCEATLPEQSFRYAPFTASLDYSPRDSALLYAKYSRGHRAGGYNLRGATLVDFGTFGPERVDAYEIGSKTDFFGHRLRVNLALYRSMYEDIQLAQSVSLTGDPASLLSTTVIRNEGTARIEGGELEVTWFLGPVRMAGTLGKTRAKFERLAPTTTGVTRESNFLMTPPTTASLAVDAPLSIGSHGWRFHADYSWRDDVAFVFEPGSLARQEAYGLLNALISARSADSRFEFTLWARNLTNTRYFVRAFETSLLVVGIPGDPRTLGLTVAWRLPN